MKVTVFSCFLLSCLPSLAQLEEISPAVPPIIADSSDGVAQEPRAHIPYKIPDGTPPPPEPPKPVWTVPASDVVAEKSINEGGRAITVREIKPIALPAPPEPAAAPVISVELRQRLAEYREKHPHRHPIALGATVYRLENEITRTLVTVWITGQREPVSFWSSGDFSLLSGIGAFTDKQGETRALFMLWSIYDTNRFAKRMTELGRPYKRPIIPDLPSDKAAYLIHQGSPDDDLFTAIDSLHEILNHDAVELRRAYEGRVQATKEREAYLKANPPQPKDITLNYWRISKPAATGKGEASR
jgi:hypothetical protein